MLAANCYVLAAEAGGPCVIVDPGMEAVPTLKQVLAQHELSPVAIALTHGHLDHTWSVPELVEGYDIPVYLHEGDGDMVRDPLAWHSAGLVELVGGDIDAVPRFSQVTAISDRESLQLAGVELTVRHTPGHTRGSVVYLAQHPDAQIMLSGDTLFNQGIGRTDLPGGSTETILRSLDEVCLSYEDDTVVLPGHGTQTSVGNEKRSNPFILEYRRQRAMGS